MSNLQPTQPSGLEIPSLPANRIRKFMETYARTGELGAAAKAARISLATHHQMLETSDSYRNAFEAAQQQVADLLEAEAFRRALAGSNELLIFLLRAWVHERYAGQIVREHLGAITLSEQEAFSERETLARLIPMKRERVQ
jgi:hypothetical protein